MRPVPTPADLVRKAEHEALHLEMRDGYMRSDPWFQAWRDGRMAEFEKRKSRAWLDLVRDVTERGVAVRRVRIVSVPESEYIRFEHATTSSNVEAGEEIRWLPRRNASTLCLPGNDCWIIDGQEVLFNHFTGEGELSPDGKEYVMDPDIAGMCRAAFLAAWDLGVDHAEYKLS